MSPDEIVSAYPTITLSDVHAALAYYFEHRTQIDAAIKQSEEFVERSKANAPSLVREKLQRKGSDATDDPVSPR